MLFSVQMKQNLLLEREISSDQAAKVIDFLRREGLVWHDSYVLVKVPPCTEVDFIIRKELSERLGVALKEVMPDGVYGGILGKFDPLTRDGASDDGFSCKTWINFGQIPGEKIIKVGFKSALARIERLQLGQDTLELLAEFATIRSPSFLPEVPTQYSLHVKDIKGCPKLSELDSACAAEVRQYLTELSSQLREI